MDENKQEEMNLALKELTEKFSKMERENQELKQALITGNTDGIKRVSKEKGATAHVRMVDDKVVVAYNNKGTDTRPLYIYSRQDPNDNTKRVNYADIVLEDGTVLPVDHIQFLNEAPRVQCKIVSRKEFHWTEEHGAVTKKEVKDYSTVELDEDVEQVVKGVTFEYLLELPEQYGSRKVTLSDSYGLINA
jgi:hypothetical protein